jgi:hypothetical protein
LVTVVGTALMVIAELVSVVRAMMFRAMFHPGGFNGTGGGPGSGFSGGARFAGGGFGLTNYLTIIGLIVVIVGIVWLGMALRKPAKT